MASKYSSFIRLTIVTPIALMAGRLQNLEFWISTMGNLPIEVILIHDKKDEKTGIEVQELVNRLEDSRITLIEGLYGAPGLARNAGLAIAKGEWICFWDSDDLPQVENFYRMVDYAATSGAECAVGGFTAVHDVTGKKKSHILTENYLDEIAINPGIWRFAFKQSALKDLNFSSLLMAEDQLFLAEFEIPRRRIEISSKSVYQYFLGENFHLTRNKAALRDLPAAVTNSLSLIEKLSKENIHFASVLLSRQVITALRNGSMSTRLQVLKILLSGWRSLDSSYRKEILRSIAFVICNRESIL
jgi:glycosyltransferase involved in cell wall biosynthesis